MVKTFCDSCKMEMLRNPGESTSPSKMVFRSDDFGGGDMEFHITVDAVPDLCPMCISAIIESMVTHSISDKMPTGSDIFEGLKTTLDDRYPDRRQDIVCQQKLTLFADNDGALWAYCDNDDPKQISTEILEVLGVKLSPGDTYRVR